jgi:4-amino-4-deoxy-L-arabinose transferase-like glycosyltransferase
MLSLMTDKQRYMPRLIESLIFVLCFFILVSLGMERRKTAAFHVDEAHKISETYYYYLFFGLHDFHNPDWNTDFFSRTNPPVAKYIMGAYLETRGQVIKDLSLENKFCELWSNEKELRRQVSDSMLLDARAVSVVFGVLTLFVLYLIGRLSGSVTTGILSALLLAGLPLFQYYATVALTDSILLFFMTAVVLATIVLANSARGEAAAPRKGLVCPRNVRIACWVLVLAILITGAAGVKFNGLLAAAFFAVATTSLAVVGMFTRNGKPVLLILKTALIAAGVLLTSAVLFVAINPYLYDRPLAKVISVFKTFYGFMVLQMIEPGPPLLAAAQKISAAGVYNFALPQTFLLGNGETFYLAAFVTGIFFIIIDMAAALGKRKVPVWHIIVTAWIIVYGLGVGVWIRLAWDRYFLPLAPFIALTGGYGLARFGKFIRLLRKVKLCDRAQKKQLSFEAFGIIGAVAISLVLSYGIIDLSLLPPEFFLRDRGRNIVLRDNKPGKQDAHGLLQLYQLADLKHPGNPLRMLYAADMKVMLGDAAGACPLYESAVGILESGEPALADRIIAATCRNSLAFAYYRLGRYNDAIAMMQTHIAAVNDIGRFLERDGAGEDVIDLFGKLVKGRERVLENLVRMRGGR